MGYRSRGEIRIVGPKDAIMGALAKLVLAYKDQKELQDALAEYKIVQYPNDPKRVILGLSYEGWTWYPSYPDVQAMEAIWSACDEIDDENVSGAFVRLGERDDDIEKRYIGDNGWDLVEVEISISAIDMNGPDLRDDQVPEALA